MFSAFCHYPKKQVNHFLQFLVFCIIRGQQLSFTPCENFMMIGPIEMLQKLLGVKSLYIKLH